MRSITSVSLLVLKAALFVVLGTGAASLLILRTPQLSSVLLLACCVWAFARVYYFCFYVVERYIDRTFRFAGISSAIVFLVRRGLGSHAQPSSSPRAGDDITRAGNRQQVNT